MTVSSLIMQEKTFLVFLVDVEYGALHLRKCVSSAFVHLINGIEKVSKSATSHSQHLLKAIIRKELHKALSYLSIIYSCSNRNELKKYYLKNITEKFHIIVEIALFSERYQGFDNARKQVIGIDAMRQYFQILQAQIAFNLFPNLNAELFYNCVLILNRIKD